MLNLLLMKNTHISSINKKNAEEIIFQRRVGKKGCEYEDSYGSRNYLWEIHNGYPLYKEICFNR